MPNYDNEGTKEFWWEGLNDTWSKEKVTFLTSGNSIDNTKHDYFLGDFVFHRFFGTDDKDIKIVRTLLIEVKRWDEWIQWLKIHQANKSLLPLYVRPLEQVIMSKKSFRIVKWVDEFQPFDI